MNYKPGVSTDSSGKLYTNALVFSTPEEALDSANELMSRWFAVLSTGIVETTDAANHFFIDGRNVPIYYPNKEPK